MTAPFLTFFVPGRPFKKERPRVGQGRVYTHPETEAAEKAVRWYAERVLAGREPLRGPVRLDCVFVFARPASQRGAARTASRHAQRPDVDNLVKLVLDALNPKPKIGWAGAWLDDGQVCVLECVKLWENATLDLQEGTRVVVTALDEPA